MNTKPSRAIAIVGVSALYPGSLSANAFWSNIVNGVDLLSDVPESYFSVKDYYDPDVHASDKIYVKRGGFLPKVQFEPMEYGIPPNIVPATDTSQLLALKVAKRVLEDATSGDFSNMDRERVSCILGVASTTELIGHMASRVQQPVWEQALRNIGLTDEQVGAFSEEILASYTPWQESTFPGMLGNVVPGRISNRLDLRGTNVAVDAACASSLAAIDIGLNKLYLGESDLVISGGVDTLNNILMFMSFSKTPALSPSGDCRPFSAAADGTMLGEGIGMVALKRLEDAERDGDCIYAVIKGLGSSSDGRAKSIYAPTSDGQAKALFRTYQQAGYGPETVELVEAHGTGTKAGDKAEFTGLTKVFAHDTTAETTQWCALGTIKSQLGHTKAAAGAAGLLKIVMALHHKILPPTIKVEQPHPDIDFKNSPFFLNTETRPWIRNHDNPRRASVSAFGFGGTNFHCTVEEYTGLNRKGRLRTQPCELLAWSAENTIAMVDVLRSTIPTEGNFRFLAQNSLKKFDTTQPVRATIVAVDARDLQKKINEIVEHITESPKRPLSLAHGVHFGVGRHCGGIAFIFPGQGSQYLNMGADLAMYYDAARAVWDAAANTAFDGHCVHEVVFPIPTFTPESRDAQRTRLMQTEWAQPALGVTSLATLRVLETLGIEPSYVGGHSYGEITALGAAGIVDEHAMLRISRKRGELMADSGQGTGAMVAVVAELEILSEKLHQWERDVVVANHNGPRQVVLSGAISEIEKLEADLNSEGFSHKRLPVTNAFHSPLVSHSIGPFAEFLEGIAFHVSKVPVFANTLAGPYPRDEATQRDILAQQIGRPVRFVEQIRAMYNAGIRTFVEVGPDSTLTTLVRQILQGKEYSAVATDHRRKRGIESFFNAVGSLAAAGVDINLTALWEGYEPIQERESLNSSTMTIELSGANTKPSPKRAPTERAKRLAAQLNSLRSSQTSGRYPEPRSEAELTPACARSSQPPAASHDLERLQQETARVQLEYQRMMAESHNAFLQIAERASHALAGGTAHTGVSTHPSSSADHGAANGAAGDPWAAVPVAHHAPPRPTPTPTPAYRDTPLSLPLAPDTVATPRGPSSNSTLEVDTVATMLEVVSEKTGYPTKILELSMDLEADLGIDSIKRVEILSALEQRIPSLPQVETSELAALATLQQIVDYIHSAPGSIPCAPSVVDTTTSIDSGINPVEIVFDVIAEKTGYPSKMLELPMDLEVDLGIDSIKRVEILSALEQRVPSLPPVETAELATLRTLKEIVDYMSDDTLESKPEAEAKPKVNATVPTSAATVTTVHRHTVRRIPAPRRGLAMHGLAKERSVTVVTCNPDLGAAFRVELTRKDVHTSCVAHASEVPPDASCVIYLKALEPHDSVAATVAMHRDAFQCAASVASRFEAEGGIFVTVQDTGGDFGRGGDLGVKAFATGLPGLVKSANKEWPEASVRAIDIDSSQMSEASIAQMVLEEMWQGGSELEVGIDAHGGRYTYAATEAEVGEPCTSICADDVFIVSGGARGITAASVVALARKTSASFILLGRTELENEPDIFKGKETDRELKAAAHELAIAQGEKATPASIGRLVQRVQAMREIRHTLDAVTTAGSRAQYLAVDVRNRNALSDALNLRRMEWGPITGLIHGAGVIADESLTKKSLKQFDAVFQTKVDGLHSLLEVTRDDPLQLICLFSSISARTGSPGQSDYAMANEVLNRVAIREQFRRPQCIVKSIGWGPWESGMMTPELVRLFTASGMPPLTLEQGTRALVAELMTPEPQEVDVVVVNGVSAKGLNQLVAQGTAQPQVRLGPAVQPYLSDHCIQGRVVVPVVMAMEWLAREIISKHPTSQIAAIRNFRVMRGVTFDRTDESCIFTALGQASGDGIELELRDEGGHPRYALHADIDDKTPEELTFDGLGDEPPKYQISKDDIYRGGTLFHGPRFQCLRNVHHLSDSGARATLHGVVESDWPQASWVLDPLLMDGCLQLAALWGENVIGKRTLPMRIDTVVPYCRPLPGELSCELVGTHVSSMRTLSDMRVTDPEGNTVCDLRGVEMFAMPNGNHSS